MDIDKMLKSGADMDTISKAAEQAITEDTRGKAPVIVDVFPSIDDWDDDSKLFTDWLIEGIIPMNSEIMVYGAPEAGKTFLVLDWAKSITSRKIQTWHGRRIHHGDVCYITAEGQGGFRKRVRAWRKMYGTPDYDFHCIPAAPKIDTPIDLDRLIATIDARDKAPKLIVIDTLFRCFSGDEIKGEDIAKFFTGITALRTRYNCSILVIHHIGKDESKGARGHSAIKGALDVEIYIKGSVRETCKIECTKSKDSGAFKAFSISFESVEVSKRKMVDDFGNPFDDIATSLVVAADDADTPQEEKTERRQRGDAAKQHGQVILECIRALNTEEHRKSKDGRIRGAKATDVKNKALLSNDQYKEGLKYIKDNHLVILRNSRYIVPEYEERTIGMKSEEQQ